MNHMGVRGEIFTLCMDSPDDPLIVFNATNYEGKYADPEAKRKDLPESVKPDDEKGKRCHPTIFRGIQQISMKAHEFQTGRLYTQRELWDAVLDFQLGLSAMSFLILYYFYDQQFKCLLWIDKSRWLKFCEENERDQHEFSSNYRHTNETLPQITRYLH